MKTKKLFLGLFAVVATVFFISCEDNNVEPDTRDYGILPERFKVDIPNSISNELKSASLKSAQNDTLSGNDIYEHLTNFIAIGEGAADIVEAILWSIAIHNIDQVKFLEYVSEDDNRTKILVVESGVEFDGRAWEYQLTITDKDNEGNEDGGIAMQVFWNTNIIEGITLIKPSNLNVQDESELADAMFSIEYSEGVDYGYDAHMIVEIAEVPLDQQDMFSVDALKMFVGKKGDLVEVFGNSNHPMAQFNYHNEVPGFNWAFVAAGYDNKDLGIAEVGLPSSAADINSRTAILEDNSIKTVLTNEMTAYIIAEHPQLEGYEDAVAAYLAPYLKNTEAPGFFDANGFVTAGEAPSTAYAELEASILELTPYNPKTIAELVIEFK